MQSALDMLMSIVDSMRYINLRFIIIIIIIINQSINQSILMRLTVVCVAVLFCATRSAASERSFLQCWSHYEVDVDQINAQTLRSATASALR